MFKESVEKISTFESKLLIEFSNLTLLLDIILPGLSVFFPATLRDLFDNAQSFDVLLLINDGELDSIIWVP
jgi:hypothetical protein